MKFSASCFYLCKNDQRGKVADNHCRIPVVIVEQKPLHCFSFRFFFCRIVFQRVKPDDQLKINSEIGPNTKSLHLNMMKLSSNGKRC